MSEKDEQLCQVGIDLRKPDEPDLIDHPPHYTHGPVECIDVIEELDLGFHLGCVLKYLWRAGHKDDALADLKKARWYLDRKIHLLEEDDGEM